MGNPTGSTIADIDFDIAYLQKGHSDCRSQPRAIESDDATIYEEAGISVPAGSPNRSNPSIFTVMVHGDHGELSNMLFMLPRRVRQAALVTACDLFTMQLNIVVWLAQGTGIMSQLLYIFPYPFNGIELLGWAFW